MNSVPSLVTTILVAVDLDMKLHGHTLPQQKKAPAEGEPERAMNTGFRQGSRCPLYLSGITLKMGLSGCQKEF